jgi:glycogen debranching enzyme
MHAGVECIDVACYTCEALERLGDMAEFLGQPDDQARFENLFGRLRQRIQTEWWLEDEGLFADMRASKAELRVALQHLDATAQKLNRTAGTEDFYRQVQLAHDLLAPGFSQHKNMPDDADVHWLLRHWVVMCPVEVGIATPEQAARTLTRLQTSEFCSEWGMQLHPQRANVMSINTGLLALSMARAGAGWVDAALRLVRKQAEALSYRTPGAISEALPDQWCFVQLWSNLGVWSPVVECFLGIRPDAGRRKLRIAPRLPATWTHAKVQQLRVGEARIDVGVTRVENADEYAITLKGAEGLDVELAGARLQTA